MAGLLLDANDGLWVLDPWGAAICRLGPMGEVERSWRIPFETESHTALISGSAGVALVGAYLVTASKYGGAEVGFLRMPAGDAGDAVELEVADAPQDCPGPYGVAGDGAQAILAGDGGNCLVRVVPQANERLQLTPSWGHGQCGILSGAAWTQGQLVVVSHVFGECFSLGGGGQGRWQKLPTPGMVEPYLVADATDRLVLLGKGADGRWLIRDGGDLIVVDDALDPEDTPRGFLATNEGYLVLRESARPDMWPECSVLILQRTGDACRLRASTSLGLT